MFVTGLGGDFEFFDESEFLAHDGTHVERIFDVFFLGDWRIGLGGSGDKGHTGGTS
jgi:hypothetical protein